MQTENRLEIFIHSLDMPGSDLYHKIRKEAIEMAVPTIRHESAGMLKFIINAKNCGNILEIGGATGVSALFMAENSGERTHITSIERNRNWALIFRKNIEISGLSNRIFLIEGDAGDILKELVKKKEKYDMIFLDAAKAQYITWLDDIEKILEEGGILVSDNIFFDGDILDSRFAVRRRDRTIHERMREYIFEITHRAGFITSLFSAGDGMALSVKVSDTGK